jgi:hypothetical protein
MEDITIPNEQIEQVRSEVAPVLAAAKALVVTDRGSYEQAMALGAECASRIKKVEAIFTLPREAAYKAWRAVNETVASFVDPLKEAKTICGDRAKVWAREEEARVRHEEAVRLEAAKKQVEESAKAAGVAPSSMGLLGTPIQMAVLAPPKTTEQITASASGSVRSNWTMRVTDLMALVKAVAAGEVDITVLQANETELRKRAKVLKAAMKYPGVEVANEGTTVFKTR